MFDLAWVGKILRITDPRISPDGKSLAVVVAHPDYDEDIYASDLVLVDTATGKTRYLTHDRKHVSFPRWSPSGDRIAFLVEDADKHNQIFVLDMAGGESHAADQEPDLDPAIRVEARRQRHCLCGSRRAF